MNPMIILYIASVIGVASLAYLMIGQEVTTRHVLAIGFLSGYLIVRAKPAWRQFKRFVRLLRKR